VCSDQSAAARLDAMLRQPAIQPSSPSGCRIPSNGAVEVPIHARGDLPRQVFADCNAADAEWGLVRRRFFGIISHDRFDAFIGFIVVLNGIAIGVEIDWKESVDESVFLWMEIAFLSIFVLELFARLFVFRLKYFLGVINIIDLVIVIFGIVALSLTAMGEHSDIDVRTFSMIKVARLLRLTRVMRLYTQFRSLWIIVQGLHGCMSTVLWTTVLLSVVCYVFAVVAVEAVSSSDTLGGIVYDHADGHTLEYRFRTIGRAIISLLEFFAIDNVSHKGFKLIMAEPLVFLYLLAFLLFVPIVLLNLITAVIVELSVNAAQEDEQYQYKVSLAHWQGLCDELGTLFKQMVRVSVDDPETAEFVPTPVDSHDLDTFKRDTQDSNSRTTIWEAAKQYLGGGTQQHVLDHLSRECSAKLTREQVRDFCENARIREKLNFVFSGPPASMHGVERLMELFPVLDQDGDGLLSMQEFTEGLGRLHDMAGSRSAEVFMMVRLVKELAKAQEERQAHTRLLEAAQEERKRYFGFLREHVSLQDQRLQVQERLLLRMCEQLESLCQGDRRLVPGLKQASTALSSTPFPGLGGDSCLEASSVTSQASSGMCLAATPEKGGGATRVIL